jgi:hypothetical protein
MTIDKAQAAKKGWIAAGTLAGSVLFYLQGWPVIATAALGASGYFGYKWFMFRAQRGMRF